MNKLILLAIALFLTGGSVKAGLGETLDQTVQRYGQVLKKSQSAHIAGEAGMQYDFSKNGFRVQVSFINGKVAWILYMKDGPIFEGEIQTLLDNNAEGSTWTTGRDTRDNIMKKKISYERADGLATADYEEFSTYHGLIIITKEWRRAASPNASSL